MASRPRKTVKAPARPAAARRPWWMLSLLVAGWMLCLAALGGWALDYASDPESLPLKVIRINGEFAHLQPERLQQEVARAIDGGFFSVDMSRVREAVMALPWVAETSVRRVWPHTLVIEVSEQVPVARWGARQLVNAAGEVFSPDGVKLDQPLPRLAGPADTAPQVVTFYTALQSRLAGTGLGLKSLRLDERRDWRVKMRDGMTLILGHQDVDTRLAQFLTAYPRLVSDPQHMPARVDMRYGHGFAVAWRSTQQVGKQPRDKKSNNSKRGNA